MRRFLIAIALVALTGLIVWFLTRSATTEPIAPAPPASKEPARTDQLESKSDGLRDVPSRTAAEVVPPQPAPLKDALPNADCFVFGRIIEADGTPVTDSGVRLVATGRWSDDFEPPEIERSGRPQHAIEVNTGADGRFRLEVPLPTADYVSLVVDPDKFHGYAQRGFGSIADRNEPRLVRGDNDVGDIVVATTGSIRGHITDQEGKPVAKTRLSFVGAQRTFAPVTTTPDGSFELFHVLPGTWTMTLHCTGWLTAKLEGVVVQSKHVTENADILLVVAPTISGIVVDPKGAPLADVNINGVGEHGGFNVSTRSDATGAFVLSLPDAVPHALTLGDQPRFEPWIGTRSEHTFAPGTRDVRIVLTPVVTTTFRVVDASTDAPIELFGIAVDPDEPVGMSRFDSPDSLRLEHHPRGETVLPAAPDHAQVQVLSTGRACAEVRVKWDRDDQPVQTIRLSPGGGIAGRLVFGSRPVVAKIILSGDFSPRQAGDRAPSLGLFTGRDRRAVTDEQGRFEFHDLAAGIYQLTIDSSEAARSIQHGVHVEVGSIKDLGAITLEPGATIRVHVKLAPGVDASGLRVFLGERLDRKADVPDTDGALVLKGIEAGKHVLTLQAHQPAVPAPMKQTVEIATGETRDVEFDLVPHDPCKVTVHVTKNGEAVAWVRVRCRLMINGFPSKDIDVGTTNDEGVASGTCPGGSTVRFVALAERDVPLGASEVVTLPPSGAFEEKLALATADLTVQLPASVTVPPNGSVVVTLTPVNAADTAPIVLRADTKSGPHRMRTSFDWTATTIDFDDVTAGEYDAVVEVHRFEKKSATEDNVWMQTDVRPKFKTQIVIEGGKSAVIVVP